MNQTSRCRGQKRSPPLPSLTPPNNTSSAVRGPGVGILSRHTGSVGKSSFLGFVDRPTFYIMTTWTHDDTCQERAVRIFDVLRIKPGKAQVSSYMQDHGMENGQPSPTTESDLSRRSLMIVSFIRSTPSLISCA